MVVPSADWQETPIGEVVSGLDNLKKLYSYGDMEPFGAGPAQRKVATGPEYIETNFPKTDRFRTCTVKRIMLDANVEEEEVNDAAESEPAEPAVERHLNPDCTDDNDKCEVSG